MGGTRMKIKGMIVLSSLVTAAVLISGGYGYWEKELIIEGDINVVKPESIMSIPPMGSPLLGGTNTLPDSKLIGEDPNPIDSLNEEEIADSPVIDKDNSIDTEQPKEIDDNSEEAEQTKQVDKTEEPGESEQSEQTGQTEENVKTGGSKEKDSISTTAEAPQAENKDKDKAEDKGDKETNSQSLDQMGDEK